jgi:hypothetical protein
VLFGHGGDVLQAACGQSAELALECAVAIDQGLTQFGEADAAAAAAAAGGQGDGGLEGGFQALRQLPGVPITDLKMNGTDLTCYA